MRGKSNVRLLLGPMPKCSIEWCPNSAVALRGGLCIGHAKRKSKGLDMDKPWRKKAKYAPGTKCAFKGCDRAIKARGLCNAHYQQSRLGHDLIPLRPVWTGGNLLKIDAPCACHGCLQDVFAPHGICANHRFLARKYGMTYDGIVDFWGDGCCRICGGAGRPAIDHDHACCPGSGSCGRCVRGLLCAGCNTALGGAKDSPDLLRSLARYLENYAGMM